MLYKKINKTKTIKIKKKKKIVNNAEKMEHRLKCHKAKFYMR